MIQSSPLEEFKITLGLPIDQELHRIAAAELEFAIRQSMDIANRPRKAVHQCRKSIKRLRALVRLGMRKSCNPCLGIDHQLRAVGRKLAPWRDADVLARTAAMLGPEQWQALDSVKSFAAPKTELGECATEACVMLRAAEPRLHRIFSGELVWTFESIREGIKYNYRFTRRSMRRFRRDGRPGAAHDWRQGVQRHINQLRLIESFDPSWLSPRIRNLDVLSETLGDYNDLSILRSAIKSKGHRSEKHLTKPLRRPAKEQQRELKARALELGAPLFSEKSRTFADRLPAHTVHSSVA